MRQPLARPRPGYSILLGVCGHENVQSMCKDTLKPLAWRAALPGLRRGQRAVQRPAAHEERRDREAQHAEDDADRDAGLYLPEIKYRRALNKAFGPGGWGLAPRSETNVGPKVVSREYALVCLGRCVLRYFPDSAS